MNAEIIHNLLNLWICVCFNATLLIKICVQKTKIRRWWTKPHLEYNTRDEYGAYGSILTYFKYNDSEEFVKLVGMTVDQFDQILHLVTPHLLKRSLRRSLQPELRLAAVLN